VDLLCTRALSSGRGRREWAALCSSPDRAKLFELTFAESDSADPRAEAERQVRGGRFDAALWFSADFSARLSEYRRSIAQRGDSAAKSDSRREMPRPDIIFFSGSDKSQIAYLRLSAVLDRWAQQIIEENLKAAGISRQAIQPMTFQPVDLSDRPRPKGAVWSKILPVLLMLWALTGAFYPAIDLCAGEKERGTLETLLSSPAERGEIVFGKLLTIMIFSVGTAVLNLLSVGITGWVVMARLPGFGLPSATAIVALLVALIPTAALFSALCLALAALARSTKEGQYYLMPLLLLVMPLVILPMAPGVELTLGNSLIPITGIVLFLRGAIEGNLGQIVQYAPIVACVTLIGCWLAGRWAIEQFNSETVRFRESERFNLRLWRLRLHRQRQALPSPAAALFCGALILVIYFFVSFALKMPSGFGGFARTTLMIQLGVILAPARVVPWLLPARPRQTLLLRLPAWWTLPAAALLAVVLHPAANRLQVLVQYLYPFSEEMGPALAELQNIFRQTNLLPLLLLIALTPAVCEELAFRGFILSGFRQMGGRWRAIILSAAMFGLAHGVFQQSLIASLTGVVIGFLAFQSNSILPGMIFHLTHNSLALLNNRLTPEMFNNWPILRGFAEPIASGGCLFTWPMVLAGAAFALIILGWFGRLGQAQTPALPPLESFEPAPRDESPLVVAG